MTSEDPQTDPPPPWDTVRELLEAALEHPPEAREEFLRGRAPSPAALAEALALLAHADDSPGREAPSLRLASPMQDDSGSDDSDLGDSAPGAKPAPARQNAEPAGRLGPWELRRRIGRGGMADVWLAVRADGLYQRKVAIKRLHPGLASDETLARFERERQILASLSHPGIAKMLDAGADDDGVPYIVMEYVAGQHVGAYADERRLSLRERMALVVDIAQAVQAAHRMHVVHRDIKPSNVLVDPSGRATLVDFGVAKVLDPEKDASAHVTREVAGYLTLNYASPEQAAGSEPGPTSDVYSLGALAYELATGHPPLDLVGRSTFDALGLLGRETPPALGERFRRSDAQERIAEARSATPRGLGSALSDRSLEAVLQAALRKEPARRPPDAGALGAELQRWLGGEPVHSAPDSMARRAGRLIARNRLVFGLLAALILALTAGVILFATEAQRARRASKALAQQSKVAEERLDELRSATQLLLRKSIDSFSGIPGTERGLDRMVRAGMEIATRQDDPELQMLLAQTRIDVGVLRAKREGSSANSVERMVASLDILTGLAGRGRADVFPPLPHLRIAVARQQERLGLFEDAFATLDAARADVASVRPTTPGRRLIALSAELDVTAQYAGLLSRTGAPSKAVQEIEAALSLLEGYKREAQWLRVPKNGEAVPDPPPEFGERGRVDRGAVLANESRLRALLRIVSGRASGSETEREELATIGAPGLHGKNRIIGTTRRWAIISSIDGLYRAGEIEDARALLDDYTDWRSEATELESMGHDELTATLVTLEIACTLLRASGEDAAEAEVAHSRALELVEDSFPATYQNRLFAARGALFRGRMKDDGGDRVGAALRYSEAAVALERLTKDAPLGFHVALDRLNAEILLARTLEGSPEYEARRPKVRAAMEAVQAFEGDPLAREAIAPMLKDARSLYGQ